MSATQRGCRCRGCINIKLCRHIKLARILSRGVSFVSLFFFFPRRLHPSAPLNSPQGVSGDKLIGLIYICGQMNNLCSGRGRRTGGGSVQLSLRISWKSKVLISTAAMWNIISRSWKCTTHIYQHQEETCASHRAYAEVHGQIAILGLQINK